MPTTESPVVENIGKNFIQISNLTTDSGNTNGYSYCAKLLLEKLKGTVLAFFIVRPYQTLPGPRGIQNLMMFLALETFDSF